MYDSPSKARACDAPINGDIMSGEGRKDVAMRIDERNAAFIGWAKEKLRDLDRYSIEALEWLMAEHYQFSFANTRFLATAAEVTGGFDTDSVKDELLRNCAEENGHAALYKAALRKVGVDVEQRTEFGPTSAFLGTIGALCDRPPSAVLGTMFATETAAIFEHEVFLDISKEVISRREWGTKGKSLVAFHEMHLGGVEQSHREELGAFLRGMTPDLDSIPGDGERPTLEPGLALSGANEAIEAMEVWWTALFERADSMGRPND